MKKDVIGKAPMDLVKVLNLSLPRVETILDEAFRAIAPSVQPSSVVIFIDYMRFVFEYVFICDIFDC